MIDKKFDAALVATQTHKVLFENDAMRVLQVEIAPGVKEPLHDHPYKGITIIESPARLRYEDKNGKLITELLNEGVSWVEPVGLHTAQNVDSKTFKGYRIELKK
jgi:quercetin dioxygenase-like cupin family protein